MKKELPSLSQPVRSLAPHPLMERYKQIRKRTECLCEPLAIEDYVVQSMVDVSPTKWHLAHTTWFFETFVLKPFLKNYKPLNEKYNYLFNSYYNAIGERYARPMRGVLSRPTVKEVYDYRAYVDTHIEMLLTLEQEPCDDKLASTIILGLNHEEQHQELILTDIKHVLSLNPLYPVYRELASKVETDTASTPSVPPLHWNSFENGEYSIGYKGKEFAFDNESPSHLEYIHSFAIANRLVTNGEYIEFIEANGYNDPMHWLSLGWSTIQEQRWEAPLYWIKENDTWYYFTLSGLRMVEPHEPVIHISYFEADAYARWKGYRLPTEAEWEVASTSTSIEGSFLESNHFHPAPIASDSPELHQMFGEVWQWTQSAYSAYPGFKIAEGAIGEYNGKFMCNQMVLRGGSCVTPKDHIRRTYRNFFPPEARWQFSGIRLAKDL